MKALNVLLAIVMSLLVAAAVLEGGLRLLGMGPQPTINKFDPKLGWVKTPSDDAPQVLEFDITFGVNSLGLRDDGLSRQPAGTYRVLALGDSACSDTGRPEGPVRRRAGDGLAAGVGST
jgi:hypothetical protein